MDVILGLLKMLKTVLTGLGIGVVVTILVNMLEDNIIGRLMNQREKW